MSFTEQVRSTPADSAALDSFGRQRVSNAVTLFEGTFLYDLQPTLFESIVTGAATITHDAQNTSAVLQTTAVGDQTAALQSYVRPRYQPGKSQLAEVTFTFGAGQAGVIREAGMNTETNGFLLQQNGTTINLIRRSTTIEGDLTVPQNSWNLDTMDGTGPSGITLDFSKSQILAFDFQWLGVGRVRAGFSIDGNLYYVHEFLHANNITAPYVPGLTLPIRYYMSSTSTVASMRAICSTIISEGGLERVIGYSTSQNADVVAGDGTRTHLLSVQPKLLFHGLENRTTFTFSFFDLLVTGGNPVYWEMCLGVPLTGTTTFNDVDATYSAMEYNTAGTAGTPGVVLAAGYVSNVDKGSQVISRSVSVLYPLTLNAAGEHRPDFFDRVSILVTGIGGVSQVYGVLNGEEIR